MPPSSSVQIPTNTPASLRRPRTVLTRPSGMPIAYRPEIDGLRAVAIVPVVCYHLGLGWFSGGHVGVDVFFVISGFLITGLIWSAEQKNKFSYIDFYIRRARRNLPALLTVIGVTFLIGIIHLWPSEMELLSKSTAAAIFFVSNIFFWSQTGYFGPEAHEQPLLHLWSISVEEQFYIIFPLLLIAMARLWRRFLPAIVLGLFLTCFSLSAWSVTTYPEAAFFLLPFRAWELLLGAILAIVPLGQPNRETGIAAFLGRLR